MLLISIIIISLVFFVYFKVQQAKVPGLMLKSWYAAKSSITIGVFFVAFAVNSYNSFGSQVAAIVGLVFVVYGIINIVFGIRNYRTYLPLARKEMEEIKKAELQS
ncbi:YtpI family protein [Evansella clarkii]|uniref:YtpI family protein n=1 Tax=Evansella clarkii TaxID=79879 RepID=UPI00142F580E|nr:YtpI family protein [Evansella clarkii]